jgi:hypothetical protein
MSTTSISASPGVCGRCRKPAGVDNGCGIVNTSLRKIADDDNVASHVVPYGCGIEYHRR